MPVLGRVIVVNLPEFMEHILKTNLGNYVKGDLFRWAPQISSIVGAFKSSAHAFCDVIERHINANIPMDLRAQFLKLTLDVFGKFTFRIEFKTLSQAESNDSKIHMTF
ncbi:hypothetical protein BC939DRAFT_502117 [Gamsiella multidivaricata]|uniref:uncharacterized protein n=1 Tax=Gamsiella multidivaricata TaxID=101098 RepID=UPI00221F1834|nr:uncharacterized protein BC939DRAFT_502117 [Gamsiella multidivaricata]KAI7825667.1 hypothetical protein BC939DRAFT_502117 [Gamsiella multidivaricata]